MKKKRNDFLAFTLIMIAHAHTHLFILCVCVSFNMHYYYIIWVSFSFILLSFLINPVVLDRVILDLGMEIKRRHSTAWTRSTCIRVCCLIFFGWYFPYQFFLMRTQIHQLLAVRDFIRIPRPITIIFRKIISSVLIFLSHRFLSLARSRSICLLWCVCLYTDIMKWVTR